MSEAGQGTRAAGTSHGRARVVELPRLAIVVLSGEARGDEHVMTHDHLRIGKSKENDFVLGDETVSRFHCEISREPRGFLLRDKKSTNGTLLDGAEVREAFLRPGAIVTVGKVELKIRTYSERVEVLPSEKHFFGDAVGESLPMRELFGLLERLAPSDVSVLLGGETGTGKDTLARAIHAGSARAKAPFVIVDCASVVPSLIESELFGHEKGAFSGATDQRTGAFELAHRGTLFLDEVGELPLDLQPKLLRVLEQRSLRRVGGNREIKIDIRVVAASKRNLLADVERGKFREDLYFRLAAAPVTVPPVRERRGDIALLAETILARICKKAGDAVLTLESAALSALAEHDWPGNVRELHNAIERAAILARSAGADAIRFGDLPAPALIHARGSRAEFDETISYREAKSAMEADFERRYVTWLLARHEGNISAAARAADMDRKYLHKLAKKHGVHPSS